MFRLSLCTVSDLLGMLMFSMYVCNLLVNLLVTSQKELGLLHFMFERTALPFPMLLPVKRIHVYILFTGAGNMNDKKVCTE